MKKVFIILCALIVVVLIALNLMSRKDKTAVQAKPPPPPTKRSNSGFAKLRPRVAQTKSDPQLGGDTTPGIVFTSYTATATGFVMNVQTQAIVVDDPSAPRPTPEQAREAQEKYMKRLREDPLLKDAFAKQDEWKEKSKALRTGMTKQEVIAVMGKPTHQEQMPAEAGGQTFFYFLPGGVSMLEKAMTPFEGLLLIFDANEKVTEMNWK